MIRFPIPPYVRFKTSEIEQRTKFLCDPATEVLSAMAEYCEDRGLPLVITDSVSTPSEDKALSRISDEHQQGRAFDISVQGWIDMALQAFVIYFEQRFQTIAAVSKATGRPRLIVVHDSGHGRHIHVQVNRMYGLPNPLSLPETEKA